MKQRQFVSVFFVLFILIILLPQKSHSQNNWLEPYQTDYVSLKGLKGSFASNLGEFKALNSVWFLSGKHSVSDNLSVIYEIPYSNYAPSNDYHNRGQSTIGNVLIGLDINSDISKNTSFVTHFGFRIPSAPDNKYRACIFGITTSFDRTVAFEPNYTAVSLGGSFINKMRDFGQVRFAIGGDYYIPTEDNCDSELMINYGIDFTGITNKVIIGMGFFGQLWATEQGLDFGERTNHQFGFIGGYDLGKIKPSLILRIPADKDLQQTLNYVYGINVTIATL